MVNDLSKRYYIKIPIDVSIFYSETKRFLLFKGKRCKKKLFLKSKIILSNTAKTIKVTRDFFSYSAGKGEKKKKEMQGTIATLIKQAILEVSVVLCEKLKLIGVGFRARILNIKTFNILNLNLGYSHQIYFKIPNNLTLICLKSTKMFILGDSNREITQIAALLRSYKLPDPYKGKGILYNNEIVALKEGKKV